MLIERWTLDVRRWTFAAVQNAGLLIVGHGSTVNAGSSVPTWAHAREISRRGIFAEVQCAFWKEEPSLRDALLFFRDRAIEDIYVVPNFISEGYFTQTIIPRELELSGAVTERPSGQIWKYCAPVGSNPAMTDLLLERARAVAPNTPAAETSLLIVAHGTELNDNSAVAAKREAEKIRGRADFAQVLNVYMEEPPLVADWAKLTSAPNVIVVPFFISDGLHSYEDIPVLLGIPPKSAPAHQVHGRSLYYASALGTDPAFADLIIAQTEAFDAAHNLQSVA